MSALPEEMTLAQTVRNQADAADPEASVWVSANAGTGKTHVLTMRVMRLLLSGTAPERILCLTYTKAAAAEMSKRVFDKLAKWVTASDEELRKLLADLLERPPTSDEIARGRQLFARSIETPGGLKVQTIHAFCERLLQRFPLEAGVPPHFSILDDDTGRQLERQAIDEVLTLATRNKSTPLAKALEISVAYAADDGFDSILRDALRKRAWIEFMVRRGANSSEDIGGDSGDDSGGDAGVNAGAEQPADDDDLSGAEADYRRIFELDAIADVETIKAAMAGVLSDAQITHAVGALKAGSPSDIKLADALSSALKAGGLSEKLEALRASLLTKEGKARADRGFVTKSVRAAEPAVHDNLARARDEFARLQDDLLKLKLLDATLAILRLSSAVMQRYKEAKARRAALDYDDLLEAASKLLGSAEAAPWVLFKLDGGLDHILVDEAQDTSPVQWSVIRAIASEFFAGSGAREGLRTLFAVGDEKQSIYGFQGAAPKMFAEMGDNFEALAAASELLWRRIPLTLSFRTVTPVLDAVDAVFADEAKVPGLRANAAAGEAPPIHHKAFREGQAGLVEIWPTETYDDEEPAAAWSPLGDGAAAPPAQKLADRIADTIKGWLEQGEILTSENRPIRAGDIIILLRKRRPFADPMVKALKMRGIAVAGADRMALIQQIAVQDLMALGDFLTLPEDDLALATVLKSPLFGFTDEQLLSIAFEGREAGAVGAGLDADGQPLRPSGKPLWSCLIASVQRDAAFGEAAERLKEWRRWADYIPPYEFYAALLDRDGMRSRLLSRLGPEAADPIDEFLNLALTYDDGAPPSLLGFLDWLRRSEREIKRDMEHGRDEVRVMTVHGAKGLEAPIVFLPDTCTTRSGGGAASLLDMGAEAMPAGIDAPAPMVWPVKGTAKLAPVVAAKEALNDADAEERHRLLYVAMTRARDRLYVAGFDGKQKRPPVCWYNLICEALEGEAEVIELPDGREILRIETAQDGAHETPDDHIAGELRAEPPPSWVAHPAPAEPTLAVPLAPSRLAPLEVDDLAAEDAAGFGDHEVTLATAEIASDAFDEIAGGLARDHDGAAQAVGDASPASTEGPAPAGATDPGTVGLSQPEEPPILPPSKLADGNRFLRGTLSHALLEHLPQLDPATWDKAAAAFVAKRGGSLAQRTRDSITREVLAVLRAPQFAPLFGPDSRAEVPIAAEIERPSVVTDGARPAGAADSGHQAAAPTIRITGQIDRLALIDDDVFIVDYKTNRPPPHDVEKVAEAYLLQLAAYRLAIRDIFPGRKVRAAILWTDGVRIMEMPDELLDLQEERLWRLNR